QRLKIETASSYQVDKLLLAEKLFNHGQGFPRVVGGVRRPGNASYVDHVVGNVLLLGLGGLGRSNGDLFIQEEGIEIDDFASEGPGQFYGDVGLSGGGGAGDDDDFHLRALLRSSARSRAIFCSIK